MASPTTSGSVATNEIKAGLAVIAVLALALTWVVARQLLRAMEVPDAAIESFASQTHEPHLPVAPADPQPMILPPSDRYLGPAAFVEPRRLTPTETARPALDRPFDHRPSLLPALSEEDRSPRAAALPVVERPTSATVDGAGSRDVRAGDMAPERRSAPRYMAPADTASETERLERGPLRQDLKNRESPPVDADDWSSRPSKPDRRPAPLEMSGFSPAPSDVVPTAAALRPSEARHSSDASVATRPPQFATGLAEIVPVGHADLRPGRSYLVEEGDTLQIIAKYELGDRTRWAELLYLNREQLKSSPHSLSPGTWLTMPAMRDDSQ